ncbi:MAG: hypothetical protein M3O31_16080 [Acidobacteriota bacterium]|nr:hypothetical protein [Acidobacteriota bacterium]
MKLVLLGALCTAILALPVVYVTHSFNQREQLATEHRTAELQMQTTSSAKLTEFTARVNLMDSTVSRQDWGAFLGQAKQFRDAMDQHEYDDVLGTSPSSLSYNDPNSDFTLLVGVADAEIRWYLGTCSPEAHIADIDKPTACAKIPEPYIEPSLRAIRSSLSMRRVRNRMSAP